MPFEGPAFWDGKKTQRQELQQRHEKKGKLIQGTTIHYYPSHHLLDGVFALYKEIKEKKLDSRTVNLFIEVEEIHVFSSGETFKNILVLLKDYLISKRLFFLFKKRPLISNI